jgi:Ras and EF-hand domain-containing protein
MHQIAGDDPSAQDMQLLAKQKSHELFAVCDIEEKGFITKRDMQRLQKELGLDPDQLEAVFDSLDDDKNGFLTLEEFTSGFGKQSHLTLCCENYLRVGEVYTNYAIM